MLKFLKKYQSSFVLSILFFAFYMLIFYKIDQYSGSRFSYYIFACGSLLILDICLFINIFFRYRDKKINNFFFYVTTLIFFIIILLTTDWIFKLNIFTSNYKFKIIILFFQLLYIFIILGYFIGKSIFNAELFPKSEKIKITQIISVVLYISLILFLMTPLRLYATSPGEVEIAFISLLKACVINFVISLIILFFVFFIFPGFLKKYLTVFLYFTAGFIFFYIFIFPANYGALDNFVLKNADNLYGVFYKNVIEAFFIILLWHVVLYFINHKKIKILAIAFFILSAVASIESVVVFAKGKSLLSVNNTNNTNNTTGDLLPAYNYKMMGYSRTGKNIVVILFDMMTGGDIPRIFKEHPELAETYNGFIWYPNTLTVGDNTATSMASMYGGKIYSPAEINKNNFNKSLLEIITESYEVLPNLLKEKNYVTAYTNPEYYFSPRGDVDVLNKKGIIAGFNKDYVPYWKNINREKEEYVAKFDTTSIRLLTMVSLFKASPVLLKSIIYDNGDWLIIEKDEIKNKAYNFALESWAFLDLMKDISNTNETQNTFKYFHNYITHEPYAMSKEGVLQKEEYPDPSAGDNIHGDNAYYSAKAAILATARWIDWLKKEKIYDNTMIILVSDHGHPFTESPMITPDFKNQDITSNIFTRSQAFLMVKKFNNDKDFKTDWRFMSNGDIPSIICEAAGIYNEKIGKDPTTGEPLQNRVLDTFRTKSWRWEHLVRSSKFDVVWHYQVKDSIFNDKNWTKIK